MTIVRIEHVRAAGMTITGKPLCARGIRQWWRAHGGNGEDWRAFLRDGVPAEQAEATGDAFAVQAARIARMESGERSDG